MKTALIYSSLTGNTRKLAEAVLEVMPFGTPMYPVNAAPEPEPFDLLALGFWVDKGGPDSDSAAYMARLRHKTLILFGTLGAGPESEHGRQVLRRTEALLRGNRILGGFLCQGRIDPGVLKRMLHMAAGNRHRAMTPERMARIKQAQTHPDARDLHNAREAVRGMLAGLPAS